MKTLITIAAVLLATPALADSSATANSNSQAWSGSTSSVNVDASNGIYLDQRAPSRIDSTVRAAPAVQAPAMGSGHPCGLSASVGISIIGGGVSGGSSRVDEACLLAQMGQGEAALIMIARRSPEACVALRQVGRISPNSSCKRGERAASASSSAPAPTKKARPAAAGDSIANWATCTKRSDGTVVVKAKSGATARWGTAALQNHCR